MLLPTRFWSTKNCGLVCIDGAPCLNWGAEGPRDGGPPYLVAAVLSTAGAGPLGREDPAGGPTEPPAGAPAEDA